MPTNEARRELLNRVRATGYPGGITEVFQAADQGIDLIDQYQMQQEQEQMQVAQTPQEQEVGLREQHAMGNTQASMAFPDVQPNQSFNTVGMKAPINIDKIDDQGHLVESYQNVPPGIQDLPTGPSEGTIIESPAAYQTGGEYKHTPYSALEDIKALSPGSKNKVTHPFFNEDSKFMYSEGIDENYFKRKIIDSYADAKHYYDAYVKGNKTKLEEIKKYRKKNPETSIPNRLIGLAKKGPLAAAMLSPLEAGEGSDIMDPKTGINKYTGEKEYTPFQKGGFNFKKKFDYSPEAIKERQAKGVDYENLELAASFAPYMGEVIDAKNTIQSLREGKYGNAALHATGFALPFVPGGAIVRGYNKLRTKINPNVVTDIFGNVIKKKGAVRLNRIEDANITNKTFNKARADGSMPYESGNWYSDQIEPFYLNKTKVAGTADELLPMDANRRVITGYLDPKDAKKFNVLQSTKEAISMSGGKGNLPIASEYVLPPDITKTLREKGKILKPKSALKELTDFYKKQGGFQYQKGGLKKYGEGGLTGNIGQGYYDDVESQGQIYDPESDPSGSTSTSPLGGGSQDYGQGNTTTGSMYAGGGNTVNAFFTNSYPGWVNRGGEWVMDKGIEPAARYLVKNYMGHNIGEGFGGKSFGELSRNVGKSLGTKLATSTLGSAGSSFGKKMGKKFLPKSISKWFQKGGTRKKGGYKGYKQRICKYGCM